MSKKSSSLNLLRKGNTESFFLPDSDEEENDNQIQNDDDDEFDLDNMDFPLPSDDAVAVNTAANAASSDLTPEQLAQIRGLMDHGAIGGKGNVGENGVRYIPMEEADQFKR